MSPVLSPGKFELLFRFHLNIKKKKNQCVYVQAHACAHQSVHSAACMWKAEDSFQNSVLFLPWDLGPDSGVRLVQQALLPTEP